MSPVFEQQAFNSLSQGHYLEAELLYQQLTIDTPTCRNYIWYLGLALLLQGKETEAQMTWMLGMMEADEDQIEQWTQELVQILKDEIKRQEEKQAHHLAWVISQHIREVLPKDGANLLKLLQLSAKLGAYSQHEPVILEVVEAFTTAGIDDITCQDLVAALQAILNTALYEAWVLKLVQFCVAQRDIYDLANLNSLVKALMFAATEAAYSGHRFDLAIEYATLSLQVEPEQREILSHLIGFYHELGQLDQAVDLATHLYTIAPTLAEKIHANFLILRSLLRSGGQWQEAKPKVERQQRLLQTLIEQQEIPANRDTFSQLSNCTFFLPYIADAPEENRFLHNGIMSLCQAGAQAYAPDHRARFYNRYTPRQKSTARPLKIGYLSHCLRSHSVGWLARWLFHYHHREQFQIYSYFVTYRAGVEDFLQNWYVERSDFSRKMGRDGLEVAEQIYDDQIDILVDLDSITADISCEVMALKPAPIQVTWLGWDASGIPAIDYYLADPYVLPESAQSYYQEKIWRLPHSYIAVDGFEVGVPTLKRDDLNISNDAIIYFSAQSGYKRHPENVRLQLKILKGVPNSYFLLKDITKDPQQVQQFFEQIAAEEGVDYNRLRFLPKVKSEMLHRANLAIADIVLDTYPYNGATTTLETLWLGIPVVTRVGKQFSARNSYTMMANAGITEGIAWNDEAYVEWGIRLGQDETLRQKIAWKLQQSKQSAPLWNGKQFTKEMEKAYKQMWAANSPNFSPNFSAEDL